MDNQDTTTSPTPLCPKCNTAFSPIPLFPAINLAQLRSNAIPSSTEKIRIRAILEIEKDQLRLYDEELDRLEGVVKKLREERNRLEQRLRNRKGWMAGIRRLPVELLVKIFSHLSSASDSTLTIYLDKDEDDAEVVLAPSLILSQVSHHWREVAVSCPDLWSSIEVNLSQPSSTFEGLITTYFRNAADHPLKITLRGPVEWDYEVDYREGCLGRNGVGILEAILSKSFRIEILKVCELDLDHAYPHNTLQCTFPLLRWFETNVEMKYAENGLLKALVEAPLLNTVSTPFVMNPMPLPYNQITSLSVEHMISIRRFEDRLSLCLNLQKLQILGYNNFDAPGYDANPLTLPSLRYLSIKLHSDTSFSRDLPRHLEFPNLYEFDLSCAGFEPHEWPCQGLMSMLQSCSSSLGRLSLGCSKYSLVPTATRQIFQLLPNLTHLRISFGEDEHGFIEALLSLLTIPESLNDTSSIVLPKLSSLDVTVFKGASLLTENVGHSIVKMMMSRRRRGLLDWQNSLETPLALITGFFTFMLNPELYDTEARLQIKEASAHFLEITDAAQLGYANVHVIALPSYNTWEGP